MFRLGPVQNPATFQNTDRGQFLTFFNPDPDSNFFQVRILVGRILSESAMLGRTK